MIIATRDTFESVLETLMEEPRLSLDTETTGLRPFHGDRLFSVIIANATEEYYFNFWAYEDQPNEVILNREHLKSLGRLFKELPHRLWFLQNAKFDMHMLAVDGLELVGNIHCTQAIGRVLDNDELSYSLDTQAKRIGLEKSSVVDTYIKDNHLWEWETSPGKAKRSKKLFFYRVPFDIIAPYGCQDARVTYALGVDQLERLQENAKTTGNALPPLFTVADNERLLTQTVAAMERLGVKIDRDFCVRAAQFETDRAKNAAAEFEKLTGRVFKASPKLFAEVFVGDKAKWQMTEKGNPSFESDVLKTFESPVAGIVLRYRDAKSKADFYQGFLYHADKNNTVHPQLNPDGTASGRFSSSEPNFQNLTAEEGTDLDAEFVVRRALVPRPGFVFFMPDYSQMEYKMMLEYAAGGMGR